MVKRIIGVLGGMGPEATLALFERIIRATFAVRDQDHFRVIIDSNPLIPDRTAAIKGEGEDCLPALVETAQNLERAGAEFIVIPCNTAHHWLAAIRAAVSVQVLDMIAETASQVASHRPKLLNIGLMATDGTLATGLYQRALTKLGIGIITPTPEDQSVIMQTIYRVKGADYSFKPRILDVAGRLLDHGARAILLGCTEIPLVVKASDLPCPVFDPLSAIAKKALEYASGMPLHRLQRETGLLRSTKAV